MKKKHPVFMSMIVIIVIMIVMCIYLSNSSPNIEGLYNVINRDTSLILNDENASIAYHSEIGLRDRIYMIKLYVNDPYKSELKQLMKGSDLWIEASEESSHRILSNYIQKDVKDFPFLKEMATVCEYKDTYLFLRIYEESIYSVEYCVAAMNPSLGVFYYFRMQT